MVTERRARPMTRMLIALFEGEEASGLAQLMRLIALARLQGGAVRVAYFHTIPRDRTDQYDRVVADRYREMLRIEEAMRERVARVLRGAGRSPVELVVRFGAPVVEVAREAEGPRPRRVYRLSAPTPVDMFHLARFLGLFGPVVDAEWGSASFISARQQ